MKGTGDSQIKYYQDSGATSYSNKWSSANSSANTATDLNTFLNGSTVTNGDTVYVKAGEYKLTAEIKLTEKALHLYGGFAGTETTSSDRKLDTNETTLNANADENNLRRVLNITTNSTVDGFTITGGNSGNNYGGGIYINDASPTITNCTITGNTTGSHVGGGFYIYNSSPTITNCTITGNTAGSNYVGGGFYIYNSSPTITNCTITGNTAGNNGGGIYINNNSPTITNCTITGNSSSGNGGGIAISGSGSNRPKITNCTIVNNTAQNGNEIYFSSGTTTLTNTLVWNSATAIATGNNPVVTYDHCAWPNATGENNIAFNTWANPVSSDVRVNGIRHKVYLAKNNSVLYTLAGKGVSNDTTPAPAEDQISMTRANPPSISAAEIVLPILSADLTGAETITAKHGDTAKTLTFTPTVSLDNEALTTGYTVSWDVAVSPAASAISIDQSGVLTVGSATSAGTYTATVKAQATYTAITTPVIKSNTAEKVVMITVESGDINLTLTSQNLPGGKVNTAYTEAQYFTATATPSSADIAWKIDGLPAGLNFDKGKISGTPTASGDFSVKVTVTATLANYNTASKDITASLKIEAAPTPTPEPDPEPGKNEDESNEDEEKGNGGGGVPENNEPNKTEFVGTDSQLQAQTATPEAKAALVSITLTNMANLEYINQNSGDFTSLTTVKISSDANVGNDGTLDLSALPESVKTFSISGNTSLKNLNLKNSKVENIEAKNCVELESVDVSGNSSIVTLDVSNTKLKLLDASGCANLTSIDCSNSGITTLSIGKSTKLSTIDCSNNSLLTLDIPSDLTDLESVNCSGQSLKGVKLAVSLNFDEFVESPDMLASPDTTASISSVVRLSATKFSNVKNLKAFSESGAEIAIVTSDDSGNITFASEPSSMIYDYDINDKNHTLMDVTVSTVEGDADNTAVSGSGGGCDTGLSVAGLLLICGLFAKFKKEF